MSDKKITDKDYLFLSAMLKAREADMLNRDRLERMVAAGTFDDAAKLLAESGWPDMIGMDAPAVNETLARRRDAIFTEIARFAPQKEVVDLFRVKYDYHNAKSIVKGEGAGVSTAHLLSGSGRVPAVKLEEAFQEDDFRAVPDELGRAMREAKSVLARTGNPQLADFVLDKAYFAELSRLAGQVQNPFLSEYVRTLVDCANLRACVRCIRMGKNLEFLRDALIPGGGISAERMAQSVFAGEGLPALFAATPFRDAAALGAEAMKGGTMTAFERECDDAVNRFLSAARRKGFGPEPVAGYLSAVENNTTAVRMVLTGLLARLPADRIKERLRDTYA